MSMSKPSCSLQRMPTLSGKRFSTTFRFQAILTQAPLFALCLYHGTTSRLQELDQESWIHRIEAVAELNMFRSSIPICYGADCKQWSVSCFKSAIVCGDSVAKVAEAANGACSGRTNRERVLGLCFLFFVVLLPNKYIDIMPSHSVNDLFIPDSMHLAMAGTDPSEPNHLISFV